MAPKSKRKSRKPSAPDKHGKEKRRQDSVEEPRRTAASTLSRQGLNRAPQLVRDTPDPQCELPLSGDLTGIPDGDASGGETVPELIAEGQDLEGEMVEAVEDAPEPDQASVKIRKFPASKVHGYKDRNKI
jgi:hypothetical protein